jgi:hypothetical protein
MGPWPSTYFKTGFLYYLFKVRIKFKVGPNKKSMCFWAWSYKNSFVQKEDYHENVYQAGWAINQIQNAYYQSSDIVRRPQNLKKYPTFS